MQVSAAVRKMQEEVEARQKAEAEAARLAEEQRIRVSVQCFCAIQSLIYSMQHHHTQDGRSLQS